MAFPDSTERNRRELSLQLALFAPLAVSRGYGDKDVGIAANRALELIEKTEGKLDNFQVVYVLWGNNIIQANLHTALELAEQSMDIALGTDNSGFHIEAHRMMDETLFYMGKFNDALQHEEQAIALYDPSKHRSHAFFYGQDPYSYLMSFKAWNLWFLGFPERALKTSREAEKMMKKANHPMSNSVTMFCNTLLNLFLRYPNTALKRTEETISFCTKHEIGLFLVLTSIQAVRQPHKIH